MDGIIILVIIYFIFRAIVKRVRMPMGKTTQPTAGTNVQQPAKNADDDIRWSQTRKKTKAMTPPPADNTMSRMPLKPVEPYRPIQSSLQRDMMANRYTGSLGSFNGEGSISHEGFPSAEGYFSTEGTVSLEGGEVFTQDVLYAAQPEQAMKPAQVLPTAWNRNALVQAVVMNEILTRPRPRRGYHG